MKYNPIFKIFFIIFMLSIFLVDTSSSLDETNHGSLIKISDAIHLNKNKDFIENIYDKVRILDNKWSKPVYNNEYIRIKFKQNLTSNRDITVYARNNQSLNTIIEVYHFNSTEKITEFPVITEEKYYKVYLTNMSGSHDSFDLRIKNLDNNENAYLDFDYIVDPIYYGNFAAGSTEALTNGMTWNHNIVCGYDMVLIVGISVDSEPTALVGSITYNGTSLTKLSAIDSGDGEAQAEMWNLTNPSCGSSLPIVVTFTNPTAEEAAGISVVYYEVDYINSTALVTNPNADAKVDFSSLDVHAAPDQWVVDVFSLADDPTPTTTQPNQIKRGESDQGVTLAAISDSNESDGTVTMGWNGFADEYAHIAVPLIPKLYAPQYSGAGKNDSNVYVGESVNHSITISRSPDGYIFSWNGTDNCTGGWSNSSWTDVSGASATGHNVSTIQIGCNGKTIGWRFYANNSVGWSGSDIETYYVYNYVPTITASVTKPNLVYINTEWMLNLTVSEYDSGDTITTYTQFYVNGTASGSEHSLVVSNNTNTNVANLSSASFGKGATLIAEYWAGDGIDNSTKTNTSSATVLGYGPLVIANATSPETVYPNTDWKFNMTIIDPDNSTVTNYVQFYVNNTITGPVQSQSVSNNTNNLIGTLSNSNFGAGATLIAEFWAGDRIDNSTKENTTEVQVENFPPPTLVNVSTEKEDYEVDDTITFISYVKGSAEGALLIDNSSDFSDCIYSVRTGCIASSSNITLDIYVQQLNATMTASENTTWYARVCNENNVCDDLITYDFDDLSNKNAYEKKGISSYPDDYDSEATSSDYTNIDSSNDNKWVTGLAISNGEYDTQLFKFNISENSSNIESLNITWEGYGEIEAGHYINLSIWNWTSESWYEINNKDFISALDYNLTGNISLGINDLVNSTTNQVVLMVTTKKFNLDFSSISGGGYHTCGVLNNGSVTCWGDNEWGKLGIGIQYGDKNIPMFVNSSENFTSVSAGNEHTCGILTNGSVMCWGYGNTGELGDGNSGSVYYQDKPIFASSSENFTSISSGWDHTCGRLVNGKVMCWGYNYDGPVGDGSTDNKYTPVFIDSIENFTSVSAGYRHTCGVLVNGSVMCWGDNYYGQLGNGTASSSQQANSPIYVKSSDNFTSVSAGGYHTCGRLVNESVMCWGRNNYGQLGIGNTTSMYFPTMVNSSENFISISVQTYHSCGRLINGSLMCWGNGGIGQLGDGTVGINRYNPVYVNSSENFTSFDAGGYHTCGVLNNGKELCWGWNYYGQVGDGTSGGDKFVPVSVNTEGNFSDLRLGQDHSCGRMINGSLMCWGRNSYGELGDGTGIDMYNPVYVNSSENFTSVGAGLWYTCGRMINGSLMCWGRNIYGQLGIGNVTTMYVPTMVNSSENFTSVSVGYDHTCGVLVNGSVMCWGWNDYGEVGDGTSLTDRHNPVYIDSNENFTSVAAGYRHTCGRLVNGKVMCWGYNEQGQVGDGSSGNEKHSPVYVDSNENFTSLSVGQHSCGRILNGSLMCWGDNSYGQIGDGYEDTNRVTPVYVNSTNNFTSVSTGRSYTCGSLINGSLMCWGRNMAGNIGDDFLLQRNNPVYVKCDKTFNTVSAGQYDHACGVLVNGSVMCWGDNTYGELGHGISLYRANPTYIVYSNSVHTDYVKLEFPAMGSFEVTGAGGDTCTPPGSGDWNILSSDNCTLSNQNIIISGALNIYGSDSGIINFDNVNLTVQDFRMNATNCKIAFKEPFKFIK